MNEPRGPVRHGSRARRPPRATESPTSAPASTPSTSSTSSAFAALARRAKLPTGPEARPAEVLRAAGLPLLMAAIVASGQAVPAVDAAADGAAAAGAPGPGNGGWTVTDLQSHRQTGQVRRALPSTGDRTGTDGAPARRPSARRTTNADTATKGTAPTTRARTTRTTPAPKPAAAKEPAPKARPTTAAKPRGTGAKPSSTPRRTAVEQPAAPPRAPIPRGAKYVVRTGDSLIGISHRYQVRLPDLLELNGLHLESIIHPGQTLRLPADAPGAPTHAGSDRTLPASVVAAAEANRRHLARAAVPTPEEVRTMIVRTARVMDVDPALALALGYRESGFQQRVVSPANAVGVMQVVPSAGRWASHALGRPLDLLDTQDNITAGLALLRAIVRATSTPAQSIAGYYQGLQSVQRHGMFDDTRRFVADVQTLMARFAARN